MVSMEAGQSRGEPQRVSREELYNLVWAKPVTAVAFEFGVSSVALAKTCRRMNIPHPGRGYWARLAAGQKIRKEPLPRPTPDQERWYIVRLRQPQRLGDWPPKVRLPTPPNVPMSNTLQHAHPAAASVARLLRDATVDVHGRLVVTGERDAVFAVTVDHHRRALLILDSFFKALETTGHKVVLKRDVKDDKPTVALAIVMNDVTVSVGILEQLESRPPETDLRKRDDPSPAGQVRPTYPRVKRQLVASGRLSLHVGTSGPRHSWSDGNTPLERHLGRIIVALEMDAQALREHLEADEQERLAAEERRKQQAIESARRAAEAAAEARRREEADARGRYQRGVERDLRRDARCWALSQQIRAFLDAVDERVPVSDRGQGFQQWLDWAQKYAERMDPLSTPYKIGCELNPSHSQLGLPDEDGTPPAP